MLLWSRGSRAVVLTLFALVVVVVVIAPLLTLLVAAIAESWTSALPSGLTGAHLAEALDPDGLASLLVSVQTAILAGGASLLVGTWAALAAADASPMVRRVTSALCHLPIAVPSVVIGLGLLIAFNRAPLVLGGTRWIVILAHAVLVLAFTFSTVAAALHRLDPELPRAARGLGASEARVLWQIRLPLLLPALAAASGLAVALSMGELGATIMIYPPSWRTLPVTIFALSDRGDVFRASASTVVLLATTVVLLLALGRVRSRAESVRH
ncbi:ABC transporter permease [Pseudonocardia spinosispora]|uniref:ABC transporter permease n=1 Tax=Pseudonocardia spinosispora TaxID=103441 RepID=UPI0003FA8CDA|nr:ABC transporter permease subunit [Pseudonocardia spinosispora]